MNKLHYFLPPAIVDFLRFCKKIIKKKKKYKVLTSSIWTCIMTQKWEKF